MCQSPPAAASSSADAAGAAGTRISDAGFLLEEPIRDKGAPSGYLPSGIW